MSATVAEAQLYAFAEATRALGDALRRGDAEAVEQIAADQAERFGSLRLALAATDARRLDRDAVRQALGTARGALADARSRCDELRSELDDLRRTRTAVSRARVDGPEARFVSRRV